MENVYDIRKEKQLQFIFPTNQSVFIPKCSELQQTVLVVNLYYEEKVMTYSQYLNQLPGEITLYIFSSREETLKAAKKYISHKNTVYLKKENRGRDISALLVSFLPYVDKYELICFLHDKKEHASWLKSDIDKWNENVWGNMIATPDYIYNILQIFRDRPELGMLFPPEPLGEYKTAWFQASWSENFNNCIELAHKMQLLSNIRIDKPPIALGSFFWARKETLHKLFNMNWTYEDFPDEPMPDDFTVSHAIERIFGYVAQDAGYDVATVMTEEYASWLLLFVQDYFRQMFFELSNRMGIDNLRQFYVLSAQKERVLNYIKRHNKFFLYGAGRCGKALLRLLREEELEPEGFIVTIKDDKQDFVEGLKVYEISDSNLKDSDVGIILTVFYPLQEVMIRELEKQRIQDYMILYDE